MALTRWPLLQIAGILFAALAHGLFSRNPMERNGEPLVFSQLEPVLRVGVTFCTMLLIRYPAGGLLGWLVTHFAITWAGRERNWVHR